jgi:hypothetical protein
MIKEAGDLDEAEEKEYLTELLANLLKKNYLSFHTQNVENGAILSHLKELSGGKLKLEDISLLKPTNTILKTVGVAPKKPSKKHKQKKRRK